MLITMVFLVSSSNTFRRKRQIIFPDSDLSKKIMSSSAAENSDLSPDTNKSLDLSENPALSPNTNKSLDFSTSKTNEDLDLSPEKANIENPKSNVKFEPRVVNGIRKPKNQVGFASPIITTIKAHYIYLDGKLQKYSRLR